MRVLVACECSGMVRDAFRRKGHEVWSCDLEGKEPAGEWPNYHLFGNCLDFIKEPPFGPFDLLIAHPPCTYLCGSAEWAFGDGPYHQKVRPGTLTGAARRKARDEALQFFADLLNADIPRICIENPVGAVSRRLFRPIMSQEWMVSHERGRRSCPPTQTIQPWQFGDDASKGTSLWLKNLPSLRPTRRIEPRMVNGRPRWSNQTDSGQNRLSPSDERGALRAVTYPGIAKAMAEQWQD